MLAKREDDLTPEEKQSLVKLLESSQEVCHLYRFLQSFLQMVRELKPDLLNGWMKEVRESKIKELVSFVNGVERDYDAVRAGLTYSWSQGPVGREIPILAYLLTAPIDIDPLLAPFTVTSTARKIWGEEVLSTHVQRLTGVLRTWGYQEKHPVKFTACEELRRTSHARTWRQSQRLQAAPLCSGIALA